jgi:SulP family sulfate permease
MLSSFIAWIPVSALAGILIVVGLRMIDREPMRFIQSSATVFDFGVVVAVIVVALTVGLIAASGVGWRWPSSSSCASRLAARLCATSST